MVLAAESSQLTIDHYVGLCGLESVKIKILVIKVTFKYHDMHSKSRIKIANSRCGRIKKIVILMTHEECYVCAILRSYLN